MKVLVVYYSRTGLTRKIATYISTKLKADIDEVLDSKDRSGPMGYMKAGKEAMQNSLTRISYSKNPKDYDLIIIGSPVWAWTLTPAIRTYADQNADALKMKRLAFFATQASAGAEKLFLEIESVCETKPIATLIINGKDFRSNTAEGKADAFMKILVPDFIIDQK